MEEKNIADTSVETVDWEARAKKAEAKIVELKTTSSPSKEEKEEDKGVQEEEKDKLDIDALVEQKLEAYLKQKWIEAQENKYKQNQDLSNTHTIWDEEPSSGLNGFKVLSVDEYSSLSPAQQREYSRESLNKNWEILFE